MRLSIPLIQSRVLSTMLSDTSRIIGWLVTERSAVFSRVLRREAFAFCACETLATAFAWA